jgi:CRISPR-associated endoribonuclease Cas6
MTSILEPANPKVTALAGLYLVLRPIPPAVAAVPLVEWLEAPLPCWIPLVSQRGVVKAIPVLPRPDGYPVLLSQIGDRLMGGEAIAWQGKSYEAIGVEMEANDLFAVRVSLCPRESLPPTVNRAIHALCLGWFAKADANLAAALHQAEVSPFTVSIKRIDRQRIELQITLLGRELLTALLWGLGADLGQEIELVGVLCRVGSQIQIANCDRFARLAQVLPQDPLELQFVSPTSFKQQQIIQPFPLPDLVFGSLLRRWNALAPQDLHFPSVQWQGLVSAYDLKTHALKMKGDEIGSVGWVRYRFPLPEQARIATILARFACFAGVGRKTAMGMGQTCLGGRGTSDLKSG